MDSLEPERRSEASGVWSAATKGRVLVVDDEPALLRAFRRCLSLRGFHVDTAPGGEEAIAQLNQHEYDAILSDIAMPGMDGIQLLRETREHDLDVPVILVTGEPAVSTAVKALEYGAFHYLTKPVTNDNLEEVLDKAVRLHRMARMRREAAELLGGSVGAGDRAGLEASFASALSTLWMAYQPIVRTDGSVYGYEALLRSKEPSLPHPGAVIEAAIKLERVDELSRTIRRRAAAAVTPASGLLFVNLHTTDLLDSELYDPESPLSLVASRVVLEITERSSLDEVKDVKRRVAVLREMGFRIAVDDLGAGYAGLTSFALLEPDIVKLDMTLVRDVHESPTKQKLIRSIAQLCADMGMLVVGEGVETRSERDSLIALGCDLLQGYSIARPGPAFPEVSW
ncbi:MAG: EAL domain-containing response regulator [Myxococcales bacterium]|nr:EAL domain-containing response regulator [Myxococcales bacterium]